MLGVLYALLMMLNLVLWVRTNSAHSEPLNVWRFFLIGVAVTGVFMVTDQTWLTYWVAFALLSLIAWAHILVFLSTHRQIGWLYAAATYGCVSLFYWLFAWLTYPSYVQHITPLVILAIGMFFCYVPPGRRLLAKYQSLQ